MALPGDPPDRLVLGVGDEVVVRLRGAGSGGYQWMWEIGGEPDVATVAVRPAPRRPDQQLLRTYSRDIDCVVRGIRPGRATVHLALRRSFNPDEPPIEEHDIQLTIENDGHRN